MKCFRPLINQMSVDDFWIRRVTTMLASQLNEFNVEDIALSWFAERIDGREV